MHTHTLGEINMSRSKCYPIQLDKRIYAAFKAIAQIKGITMKEAIRDALGLYISDNIYQLDIVQVNQNLYDEEKKRTKE